MKLEFYSKIKIESSLGDGTKIILTKADLIHIHKKHVMDMDTINSIINGLENRPFIEYQEVYKQDCKTPVRGFSGGYRYLRIAIIEGVCWTIAFDVLKDTRKIVTMYPNNGKISRFHKVTDAYGALRETVSELVDSNDEETVLNHIVFNGDKYDYYINRYADEI